MEEVAVPKAAIYAGAMPVTGHPTPWKITDTGGAFSIVDANGRSLAYVYYKRQPALRNEYLTPEEARELAIAIARLSKT